MVRINMFWLFTLVNKTVISLQRLTYTSKLHNSAEIHLIWEEGAAGVPGHHRRVNLA